MNPFWPFAFLPRVSKPPLSRQNRLQDLDARMAAFLNAKKVSGTTCPKVLESVRTARSNVQREMTSRR